MKRIISTMLVCVLLLGCVFVLASCGKKPNEDYKTAASALEDDGYTVELKENFGGCAATIYAYKNDVKEKTFDEIYIYYFDSEDKAEAAWDLVAESYEAEQEEKKGTDYAIKCGLEGKLIYKGTKAAVKASKK